MALGQTASAQTAVPVSLEGRVTKIDVAKRRIYVMGVYVFLPTNVRITTPTTAITLNDLAGAALPGRTESGFLNGTAIVEGRWMDGRVVASTVEIEPSENLLGGPISWVNGNVTIMGKRPVLIQDPRLRGEAVNDGGLPVNLDTAPEGSDAVASGYEGLDGVFYAHQISCDAAQLLPGNFTRVVSAIAKDSDRLAIRGGTTAASGRVRIYNADSGSLLGSATVTINPRGYGMYEADLRNLNSMPRRIRVRHDNGSEHVVTVSV